MALLFMDGFDHYVTADIGKKWTFSAGGAIAAVGRNSSNGYQITNNGHYITKSFTANYSTLIIGAAINMITTTGNRTLFCFIDGVTVQLTVMLDTSGYIQVKRGLSNGTLIGTSSIIISAGSYNYIEAKVLFSQTVGTVEIRVNGTTVLSLTGQDTCNTANAYVNKISLADGSGNNFTGLSYFDDVYVCDTSGATNNNFLGEVKIKTVFPTAEGTNTNWAPLSGTDNALMVDEVAQDGDTTYNSSDVLNARDTYVINDVATLGGDVFAVAINLAARKEGTEVRGIKSTLKSGATYTLGTERTLGTTYTFSQDVHQLNPDGSVAWTEATVNTIEAGIDLVT